MPSILFVCAANRFRSPLAAALLRKELQERSAADSWEIKSAGLWATPGQSALPAVAAAAQRLELDLSSHRATRVHRSLVLDYDLIVVMEAGQKEALLIEFPQLQDHVYLLSYLAERRSYDIPDPLGSEAEIQEVVDDLALLVRHGFESICVTATYLQNTKRRG